MCGIAGIYNTNLDNNQLEKLSQKIYTQLKHRGPDGQGYKILGSINKIFLLHTRLSIQDLSSAGKQPMCDKNEKIWLTFNGEIYNFKEIRKELEKKGSIFHSNTDTEVIIESYKVWGLEAFEKFIGMWAFALWDANKEQLILSRDRLGIKPLYYYHDSNSLYFSSEPKVIVDQCPSTRKVNKRAIADYFNYRQVLGNGTFFKDVKSLEPGTHLIISKGKNKTIKYWDLPIVSEKETYSEKFLEKELQRLLKSAVKYRMISDVPFGSFLSGGLDSSILVFLMSSIKKEPIKTYTIGFKEDGFNEFDYAKQVSDYFNTHHHQQILSAEDYIDAMQTMLKIKDAPLAVPNEIALHKISLALKKDISVVLSGEGADELFGGYGRIFRSSFDFERMSKTNIKSKELNKNFSKKYGDSLFENDLDHFLNQYSYIHKDEQKKLFSSDLISNLKSDLNNKKHFESLWKNLSDLSYLEKMMWIFQKIHLQGLLGRLDSASMSASVEARVPFVDHRLIEFFNKVPTEFKLRWKGEIEKEKARDLNSDQISEYLDTTKYILRKTYQSKLPNEIFQRKKVGFPVPLHKWFSGTLKSYAEDKLTNSNSRISFLFKKDAIKASLDQSGKNFNAGLKIWMMLNIEEWMSIYDIKD